MFAPRSIVYQCTRKREPYCPENLGKNEVGRHARPGDAEERREARKAALALQEAAALTWKLAAKAATEAEEKIGRAGWMVVRCRLTPG